MAPAEVIPIRAADPDPIGFIVLDDLTLGPAAGGTRTWRYGCEADALADAERLARAMTLKCSIAGLDAGGGKAVIMDRDGLDRAQAFAAFGDAVEALCGRFYTAGDLGTNADDLAIVASRTSYVRTDEPALAAAVARGWLRCVEVCAARRRTSASRLRVAIQGCGAIGAAVADAIAQTGAELFVTDTDPARAFAVARDTGATMVAPADVLREAVDVLAPCAVGGVIDAAVAAEVAAWAVCGAANNILTGDAAGRALVERSIELVPDSISSAGAVIEGVGDTIMRLPDRSPLIDALGDTAAAVLAEAAAKGETPTDVAVRRALARIDSARS